MDILGNHVTCTSGMSENRDRPKGASGHRVTSSLVYGENEKLKKVTGQQRLVEDHENTYKGHSKAVTCLSTSMDGSMLLSGSEDSTARIWHITSRQCIRTVLHKGMLRYLGSLCKEILLSSFKG
ncbi:putative WD repeat-containing protein 18 [Apostichopus japonicus]|uniref:Putative WD repeat-containing protein 18 n=1 Tax=Stichopus japonicus TaxID=307972 RepID=A0A2G8JNL4_STIJA|nr:putative WD repeat-containing protein 18 [Apostichopus japonicus]